MEGSTPGRILVLQRTPRLSRLGSQAGACLVHGEALGCEPGHVGAAAFPLSLSGPLDGPFLTWCLVWHLLPGTS